MTHVLLLLYRQLYAEHRAEWFIVPDTDKSVMIRYDPVDNNQPEPGTALLR